MADELWDELQNLELGREDPELFIPYVAYADAVARNRLSLIARPLNPRAQNLFSVISSLPRAWGLASRVHGRVLNATYVQFMFQSESDLLSVQRREPWVFNNWLVASQRWVDIPAVDFLTTMQLWVQIRGIPLPFVCGNTIRLIAERLGEIILVDYHEATTSQITFIRVRIRIAITDRLRFFQRVRFASGETALIRFQYERLRRICSLCLRITHHRTDCPFRHPEPVQRDVEHEAPRVGRERCVQRDDLHRSDLNSQSQNSDYSFPDPIDHPPRVNTPPPNANEFAAVFPLFHTSRGVYTPQSGIPSHHNGSGFQQVSSGSNITPTLEYESNSNISSKAEAGEMGETSTRYEVGESSKRKHKEVNESVRRNQNQKGKEHMMGGILKPPKKR